ncbi:MAG: hypothetical protein QM533_00435 [Cytophagales bacterium]|nr:hypothetical protein [Cytophagales bacterium]
MSAYSPTLINSQQRIEEPRIEYTLSLPADFEIPESQRRELRARLAHHLAKPNERKYKLSEIIADRFNVNL